MKREFVWNALFSQSGSEIYEISQQIGRLPNAIITNKPLEKIDTINPKLLEIAFDRMVFLPRVPTVEEYYTVFKPPGAFITLHGYLRILPPEVCFRYSIYNGHPGLITKYPELKGKDPQAKVWNSDINYKYHGHVIHKVVAEVDAGDVVSSAYVMNENIKSTYVSGLWGYMDHLHEISIKNWVAFLKKKDILNTSFYGQKL